MKLGSRAIRDKILNIGDELRPSKGGVEQQGTGRCS
jgi:hypothetical protein